ncbi:MFS transporter [Devosia pacifica]|uniref:MFS transporter n=1 Tax=Devosia pacifica TaxID=1335967 RepID=A0A918VYS7_9HYPH|nr:MFS transporter [Devosia pacifica]GHA36474.1 MFS transporter [Devosia pacifica]
MTTEAAQSHSTRNIALLSIAQAIGGSNQAIVMSIAALTAAAMSPDQGLATLPVTMMIIGLALGTGPAAFLIHRLGRKNGFMLAGAVAIPAGILASVAVIISSFILFCGALFIAGGAAAFFQQVRFAAADSVEPALKGRAVSWVMFGGVAAGFFGPQLSNLSRDWIPGAPFAAGYLVIAALAALSILVFSQTRLAPTHKPLAGAPSGRKAKQLLRAPEVFVPMVVAAITYSLMTLVMVAAPLAMVYVCGHPASAASGAIQWHIIAMFAPSFVTGMIINRIGAELTAAIGLTLIIGCALAALHGITIDHFNLALVLLGVGWNFGFIGATTLLTASYRPEEAARVQGMNEQLVFGSMAVASIGSGVLLRTIGWESINALAIPFASIGIALLGWLHIRRLHGAEMRSEERG